MAECGHQRGAREKAVGSERGGGKACRASRAWGGCASALRGRRGGMWGRGVPPSGFSMSNRLQGQGDQPRGGERRVPAKGGGRGQEGLSTRTFKYLSIEAVVISEKMTANPVLKLPRNEGS